jgi:hypothetical protein
MTKPVVVSESSWKLISDQIQKDHNPSVTLIRGKMKSVLGFTPREHREWSTRDDNYNTTIRLDFFDEQKRVMFLLRYGDFIHEKALHK